MTSTGLGPNLLQAGTRRGLAGRLDQVIETAAFGSTGHRSSRIIFGAAALGAMTQERANATIEQVRAAGINHFDTAASYGESEDRLKPWLAEHRDEVFLATKTGDRTGSAARASLEHSLERMGVDQVDLIQLHNLVEEEDWRTVHSTGGALQAMVDAQSEGLVRFIGITGHGVRIPQMHIRSLAEFAYSSVLAPLNFTMLQNSEYRYDFEQLCGACADRDIAVQTIKSIARGRWPEGFDGRRFSWYQPLEDETAINKATRWVLANAQVFLNTTSDATKLKTILEAADQAGVSTNSPVPTDAEMQADTDAFGVTPLFDGAELERI